MVIIFSVLAAYAAASFCIIQKLPKFGHINKANSNVMLLRIGAVILFIWGLLEYADEWGLERGAPPFLFLCIIMGPTALFFEKRLKSNWLKTVYATSLGAILSGLLVSASIL